MSTCSVTVPDALQLFNNMPKSQLNSLYKFYIKDEDNPQSISFALDVEMFKTRYELDKFGIDYSYNNVELMSSYFSLTCGLQEFDVTETQRSIVNNTSYVHQELNFNQ